MNIHAKGTRRKYSKRISIEKAQMKAAAATTTTLASERLEMKTLKFLVERKKKKSNPQAQSQ